MASSNKYLDAAIQAIFYVDVMYNIISKKGKLLHQNFQTHSLGDLKNSDKF
jgi:hypothetical protein